MEGQLFHDDGETLDSTDSRPLGVDEEERNDDGGGVSFGNEISEDGEDGVNGYGLITEYEHMQAEYPASAAHPPRSPTLPQQAHVLPQATAVPAVAVPLATGYPAPVHLHHSFPPEDGQRPNPHAAGSADLHLREQIHALERQLRTQERQISAQAEHTQVLTRMLLQQSAVNRQQMAVNQQIVDAATSAENLATIAASSASAACANSFSAAITTASGGQLSTTVTTTAASDREASSSSASPNSAAELPRIFRDLPPDPIAAQENEDEDEEDFGDGLSALTPLSALGPQRARVTPRSLVTHSQSTVSASAGSSRCASIPIGVCQILSKGASDGKVLPREDVVTRVVEALVGGVAEEDSHRSSGDNQDVGSNEDGDMSPGNTTRVDRSGRSSDSVSSRGCSSAQESINQRSDFVNPNDFFDPSQFHTVVSGMGGIGKTTLAALAVSRAEVREHFYDGVSWLTLGQRRSTSSETGRSAYYSDDNGTGHSRISNFSSSSKQRMSYREYADHLRMLCAQIGAFPPEFDDIVQQPGDDDEILERKTLRAMQIARQEMTNMLDGLSVLVVLDDLWVLDDLEWFSFGNRPESRFRLLVTTRLNTRLQCSAPGSSSAHDSTFQSEPLIKLEALSEDEAIELLLSEATGRSGTNDRGFVRGSMSVGANAGEGRRRLSESNINPDLARTVVHCCRCLPVAVRSAGRLLAVASANSSGVRRLSVGSTGASASDAVRGAVAALDALLAQIPSEEEIGEESGDVCCAVAASINGEEINNAEDACVEQPAQHAIRRFSRRRSSIRQHSISDLRRSLPVHSDAALHSILARSFSPDLHGPTLARALKICFATFATTFSRPDCSRPFVPTTTVHLLWDCVLYEDERTALEADPGTSYSRHFLDVLEFLGLVESARVAVRQRVPATPEPKNSSSKRGRSVSRATSMSTSVSSSHERNIPKSPSLLPPSAGHEKVIDVTHFRVHHDSMLQYARYILKNDEDLCHGTIKTRLHSTRVEVLAKARDSSFAATTPPSPPPSSSPSAASKPKLSLKAQASSWRRKGNRRARKSDPAKVRRLLHECIACRYEEKRLLRPDLSWDEAVPNDGYVFMHLAWHWACVAASDPSGGMAALRKAMALLQDPGFVRGTLDSMGAEMGVRKHIFHVENVIRLLQSASGSPEVGNRRGIKSGSKRSRDAVRKEEFGPPAFDSLCVCLRKLLSVASDQMKEGTGGGRGQNNEEVDEAFLARFHEEVGRAFIAVGNAYQKQNLWIHALDLFSEALEVYEAAGLPEDNPARARARRHVDASSLPRLVLVHPDSPNCIRLKNARRLREFAREEEEDHDAMRPSSSGADVSLELSSHPGLAIVLTRPHTVSFFGCPVLMLGVGPKESALRAKIRGGRLQRSIDGKFLACTLPYSKGDPLFLVDKNVKSKGLVERSWFGFDLKMTEDGLVKPSQNSDVALGIGTYPLVLVPRNSPNRLLFKHDRALRETSRRDGNALRMELSSHPGYAVVSEVKAPLNLGLARMNLLGVGRAEDSMRAVFDGRVISCSRSGAVFRVLAEYKVGVPISLFKSDKKSLMKWRGVNDFVINDEGSISPVHAPNLAWGCTSLGRANEIATEDEREQAERQAKLVADKLKPVDKLNIFRIRAAFALGFDAKKWRVDEM